MRTVSRHQVGIYVDNWGDAKVADGLAWSYCDLWSSATTWGGDLDNKPLSGDSVVITTGEFIILDEDPPPLYLLTIYGGTLKFADWVGDLALNASYIFVYGGRLIVGTEDAPFPYTATITLEGDRNSYELPVYGAKCIAVRNSLLDLHGRPGVSWTRLATTAIAGNNTLELQQPVDWEVGDYIFVASSTFSQYDTEEAYIAAVKNGGYTLEVRSGCGFRHRFVRWPVCAADQESMESGRSGPRSVTNERVVAASCGVRPTTPPHAPPRGVVDSSRAR